MAAGALDAEIRDPELSRVEPTPAKRAYFEGCENVLQDDREDDEVTRYIETALMENLMDLGWWKINKTSYPELAKLVNRPVAAVKGCSVLLDAPSVSTGPR